MDPSTDHSRGGEGTEMILTIFTGLSEQYRHLSGGGRQTAASSSSSASSSSLSIHQLLATSYCFCSLLLSIIQSPLTSSSSLSQEEAEMDEGAKAGKSHRHHSLGSHRQSETQHEWNPIQNSLSLVCRPEVRHSPLPLLLLLPHG